MGHAQLAQELQRAAQVVRTLLGYFAGLGRDFEPVMGVGHRDAGGQRIDPGQIDDGHDAGVFEVDGVRVLAAPAERDLAEHAQRWPVFEGVADHVRQKQAVALGVLHHLLAQAVEQFGLAVDGAQVKKHAGQHQRLGFGAVHPLAEILGPDPARLAPGVGHGHHVARAVDVAALGQAVANKCAERLEVRAVRRLVKGIVQDQTVVLVRFGGLFVARLAAGGDPDIVNRGRPQLRLGQVDQPGGEGIGDGGDDVAGAVGAGVGGGQMLLQLFDPCADVFQAIERGLFVDVARQIDGRGAVLLGQVGGGDHAQNVVAFHHGHVVDVVARHQQQGFKGRAVGAQRHGRQRGDVGDGAGDVQVERHHTVAQVAVGDQAKQQVLFDQQHG